MKTTIAVIMGTALLPDGGPSQTMRRRGQAALELQVEFENLTSVPTGGNAHKLGAL